LGVGLQCRQARAQRIDRVVGLPALYLLALGRAVGAGTAGVQPVEGREDDGRLHQGGVGRLGGRTGRQDQGQQGRQAGGLHALQ
jgi:hypothetical protein